MYWPRYLFIFLFKIAVHIIINWTANKKMIPIPRKTMKICHLKCLGFYVDIQNFYVL